MDPEANVREQRFLAGRLAMAMLSHSPPVLDEVNRLVDLILGYYEWISKGGAAAQGYYPFSPSEVVESAKTYAAAIDKGRAPGTSAQLAAFAAKILVATAAVGYDAQADGGVRSTMSFRPKNGPLSEGRG